MKMVKDASPVDVRDIPKYWGFLISIAMWAHCILCLLLKKLCPAYGTDEGEPSFFVDIAKTRMQLRFTVCCSPGAKTGIQ